MRFLALISALTAETQANVRVFCIFCLAFVITAAFRHTLLLLNLARQYFAGFYFRNFNSRNMKKRHEMSRFKHSQPGFITCLDK